MNGAHRMMKQICIFLFSLWLSAPGWAFDVGLPGSGKDPAGSYALELVAERFEREIHQDIRGLNDTFFGEQEEARLYTRLSYRLRPDWWLLAHAGMSDSEGSEDPAVLLGATAMWSRPFGRGAEAHVYLGGQWVDGITYQRAGGEVAGVLTADETRKEQHMEGTLGFYVSTNFDLNESWDLAPYIGMQLSFFRGTGEESFFFSGAPELPGGRVSGIDFKEDGQLGSTLGLRLDGPAGWYLRVEGRIIDQKSLSAGLGRDF